MLTFHRTGCKGNSDVKKKIIKTVTSKITPLLKKVTALSNYVTLKTAKNCN